MKTGLRKNGFFIKILPVLMILGLNLTLADTWKKTFGGSDWDGAHSVQETSDGGYIVAGETESYGDEGDYDVWLIKTDGDGDKIWDKTFDGSELDEAYSVQETSDGGYIVAGAKTSFSEERFPSWLIKTDGDGNKIWVRQAKLL